jgi:hypothetical protein
VLLESGPRDAPPEDPRARADVLDVLKDWGPDVAQVIPGVHAEEPIHYDEQRDPSTFVKHIDDLPILPRGRDAIGLPHHHFHIARERTGVKARLHHPAVAIMLLPIGDQHAPTEQVGDRIRIAPADFVPLADEQSAISLRAANNKGVEGGQWDLEKAASAAIQNLQRPQKGMIPQQRFQRLETSVKVEHFHDLYPEG